MNTVTITKVSSNVKETKFGPKLSVGLKIKELVVQDINGEAVNVGDRYLNAWFPKDHVFKYKEGDKIDIIVKQRGEWLDFMTKEQAEKSKTGVGDILKDHESRIQKLEAALAEKRGEVVEQAIS